MSDQRVVDNPNDVAIRAIQRRDRLEVGKRIAEEGKNAHAQFRFREPFYFRFRQHKDSQFGGLWELCVVDKNGKVIEQITDGDVLPNALEAIGNIFANAGY